MLLKSTKKIVPVYCLLFLSLFADEAAVKSVIDSTKEVSEKGHIHELDKEYVVAERAQTILENPLTESPALALTVSQVSEQDMRNQNADNVVDALTYTPGAWTETRGRKVKQFISFRGQKYPYPDYAIDGVWQREFLELPYFFTTDNIERIEVIRSSAALINGVSGLVGIINVIPKTYDTLGFNAHLDYGQYNSVRGSLTHGNRIQSLSYAAGVGGSSTDGPDNKNAEEKMLNLYGRIKWQPGERFSMQTNVFGLYGERELTLIEEPGNVQKFSTSQRFDPHRAIIANSRLLIKESDRTSSALLLYYTRRNHDFYSSDTVTHPSSNDLDWEWGTHLTQTFILSKKNVLRVGALYNNWVAPDGKRFYSGKPANVHTLSGVIADEHAFGSLLLDGGVRIVRSYLEEWAAYNINGSFVWKQKDVNSGKKKSAQLETVKDTWEKPQVHATLGARYLFPKLVTLTAHGALGQVQPLPGTVTNTWKEPDDETQIKVDAGIQLAQKQFGKSILNLFYTYRMDGISITSEFDTINGEILPLYENRDRVTRGIEFSIKTIPFFNIVSGDFMLTAMNHLMLDEEKWKSDNEKPSVILSAGLHSEIPFGIDIHLYLKFVSDYVSSRFGTDPTESYPLGDFTSLDGSLGYTYNFGRNHSMRVYCSVKNIADKKYSTVVGYPDFGRRLYGGVQYHF